MRIETLYADDDIIIVNKPAGTLSAGDGMSPALPDILKPQFGQLWVVHRLDKETSGVIALARNSQVHRQLNEQFEAHTVRKVYHAIVIGMPTWDTFTVNAALRVDADRMHRTVIDAEGKPAITHLKVLKRVRHPSQSYSLIEAQPETGRTHQIRVHLRAAGYPILADGLYGDGQPLLLSQLKRNYRPIAEGEERPLMGRVALHAFSLSFNHPSSGDIISVTAPYLKDFAASLKQLQP